MSFFSMIYSFRSSISPLSLASFELKQGGYGIAVRNPVYLKDENGQEYFLGFTIVILRVPEIFSDATSALSKFGYEVKFTTITKSRMSF